MTGDHPVWVIGFGPRRVHPIGVTPDHPDDRDDGVTWVQRDDLPYLLLGAAAAAQRRSRAAASVGAHAAYTAAWPARRAWRLPLATPLRTGASRAGAALVRDGRTTAERSRAEAQATGATLLARVGDQLIRSGLADEVVDRLLLSGVFDRMVVVVINHPATERLLAEILEDPGMERLITRVMDSHLVQALTTQLLASEEMQLLLEYVMRSPELRAALGEQTAGLAGDMAVGVRARTVVADDAAERFARSLFRRRRRAQT
ncbi:MAG: hypothetical protein WAL63_13525 [Solirubrobacteraceae bacterium]